MLSLYALLVVLTTFCVSSCEPFTHTTHHYFPHVVFLALPSFQIHHLFHLLLSRLTACFCIKVRLSSPSITLQFYSIDVHQYSAQCPRPPSTLSRAYHLQVLPPSSRPHTPISKELPLQHVVLNSTNFPHQSYLIHHCRFHFTFGNHCRPRHRSKNPLHLTKPELDLKDFSEECQAVKTTSRTRSGRCL